MLYKPYNNQITGLSFQLWKLSSSLELRTLAGSSKLSKPLTRSFTSFSTDAFVHIILHWRVRSHPSPLTRSFTSFSTDAFVHILLHWRVRSHPSPLTRSFTPFSTDAFVHIHLHWRVRSHPSPLTRSFTSFSTDAFVHILLHWRVRSHPSPVTAYNNPVAQCFPTGVSQNIVRLSANNRGISVVLEGNVAS
jgi:hypothetical protein